MTEAWQHRSLSFRTSPGGSALARTLAIAFILAVALPAAQAQTYTVLHAFMATDGALPYATPAMDEGGNLYGTTYNRTGYDWGTVWKVAFHSSGWTFSTLFDFPGGYASYPYGGVIFGPDGALYGATEGSFGKGVVYRLTPPPTFCRSVSCFWFYGGLYQYAGSGDGAHMEGDVVFDAAGNMYATSYAGGLYDGGTVFKLTPGSGGWTKTVIHDFGNGNDGKFPFSGLVFDKYGNLYGTTTGGGNSSCGSPYYSCGTVYQLTLSGDTWMESVIYDFHGQADGSVPYAPLIIDDGGNLYGSASAQGPTNGGTVFELSPFAGGWTFNLLYAFDYSGYNPWPGPRGNLVMDPAGTLYGLTSADGANNSGTIFKLAPSGGRYAYSTLYTFCSQTNCSDGGGPVGGLARDTDDNFYGTTSGGGNTGPSCGNEGCGVVFKFTP
ncbi:MAG: choice-of-anchor tandem repeat GloVer-containing protein [Candidatus Korobacteraceae bacterium]